MRMSDVTRAAAAQPILAETGLVRGLGLFDATMIVVGSMIGSGIFIVSADIARQTGSPGGLLLTWVITGVLTVAAALSYGELAAMMPRAGGQYVYLRESYSPLWGFLYGWTLFLVIQTGTIAAVCVGFARFLGVLVPAISPTAWIVRPIILSSKYAVSLSWQQLIAILLIGLLTVLNTRGLRLGKLIQNIFTSAKSLALFGLIVLGIFVGRNAAAVTANFSDLWTPRGAQVIEPGINALRSLVPAVTAAAGAVGVLGALGGAPGGSPVSAAAREKITCTAGAVKETPPPGPPSLAARTALLLTPSLLGQLGPL